MKKIITFALLPALMIFLAGSDLLAASDLAEKLSGKILLQVESSGEAWYINPENNHRYYLGRPHDAFNIMRDLGLGISERDFNSFNNMAPSRLKGRILLRVEASGEAYYASPDDLRMHYLGRPQDAFNVMREQGLGVSNQNLGLITIAQGYNIGDAGDNKDDSQDNNQTSENTDDAGNEAPDNSSEPVVCEESTCDGSNQIEYVAEDGQCREVVRDCSDCSCSCGGFNAEESLNSGNCADGLDNDCDGYTDSSDEACMEGTMLNDDITENTTWEKSASPYIIANDIIISKNITLTIEPGTEIKFKTGSGNTEYSGYSIINHGIIEALGTVDEKIIFSSLANAAPAGSWGSIEVINGGKINFRYVEIKDADFGINSPNAKTLNINSVLFTNCNTGLFFTGPAEVSNSLFENNKSGAVFSGNIANERDDGTYKNFDRIANFLSNTIKNNGVSGDQSRGGLVVSELTNVGYKLNAQYNNIDNNTIGVLITDSSYYGYLTIKYNNIYENSEYNILVDSGGPDITADENWWGTTNWEEIDEMIYDFFDTNLSNSRIIYTPSRNGQVGNTGSNL